MDPAFVVENFAADRPPRPAVPAKPAPTKIVVAIHGIGSQRRSDTIRSVARRFGDRASPPLPVMPLGFFHIGKAGDVRVSRLDANPGDPLEKIGFAEVFWADIPRQVVKDDDTLDETKAWGASVVSRAHAIYTDRVKGTKALVHEDFALGTAVVEEIVETVDVLEKLFTITEKMGLFKFELAPLLRDYVGDVQLVTDFSYYRRKIVSRFHDAMAQILARYAQEFPGAPLPEIYIVAHSEGTVVSFLGLLEALSGRAVMDPDTNRAIPTNWIQRVRGYMTIGSPIDKHILLWPRLWDDLDLASRVEGGEVVFGPKGAERLRLAGPIVWRNYFDFGDPIGFRLDTAAQFLRNRGCKAFDFHADGKKDDFGFSRYWLPGKAHNDYWGDAEVFGHFIDDVVLRKPGDTAPAAPPASSKLRGIVSTALPYLLALAFHVAAVFLLYKGLTAFFEQDLDVSRTTREVCLLGALLASITVAARLPRLVKTSGGRWHVLALLFFGVGAGLNWWLLPPGVADFLGGNFIAAVSAFVHNYIPVIAGDFGNKTSIAVLILVSAVVSWTGWIRHRKPRTARRTLILCGTLVVFAIVMSRVLELGDPKQPAWPVALAGAAFLYLWWLGILVFDLAFIWHRYVRNAVAVDTLSAWAEGHDAWPTVTLRRDPSKKAAPPAPPVAPA